jgi:translation initiation factor IF-2
MTSSKVRIYDLAKDLKIDSKRIIEEARREGVDVSVPSNSISKDLAEKIRNRHVPKKETVVARAIRVIKGGKKSSAEDAADIHTTEAPSAEVEVTATAQAPVLEAEMPPVAASDNAAPQASDPVAAARQTGSTPLVKRLAPAARAERPPASPEREADVAPAQIEPQITEPSATNDTSADAQATPTIPVEEVSSDAPTPTATQILIADAPEATPVSDGVSDAPGNGVSPVASTPARPSQIRQMRSQPQRLTPVYDRASALRLPSSSCRRAPRLRRANATRDKGAATASATATLVQLRQHRARTRAGFTRHGRRNRDTPDDLHTAHRRATRTTRSRTRTRRRTARRWC